MEVLASATKEIQKALVKQKESSNKSMADGMEDLRSQLRDEYKAQQDKALSKQQQQIERLAATTRKREMQELEKKLQSEAAADLAWTLSTHSEQADARLRNVSRAHADEVEKHRSLLGAMTSKHTQELMDAKREQAASLDELTVEKARFFTTTSKSKQNSMALSTRCVLSKPRWRPRSKRGYIDTGSRSKCTNKSGRRSIRFTQLLLQAANHVERFTSENPPLQALVGASEVYEAV